MANTVNKAFEEFLKDIVNLDSSDNVTARGSRDYLLDCINRFSSDNDFFRIYSEKCMKFGSFARNTKIRPLDDIDLMVCLSGDDRTYIDCYNGTYYIYGIDSDRVNNRLFENSNYLNSRKVINTFIRKFSSISNYSKAEIHRNQEAVTLKLKSYDWNYDIVPCFYTTSNFYLIPDGKGNWKKTDPRIDNERTTAINQKFDGNLLNVIRLVKYWNSKKSPILLSSYLLETMILDIYSNKSTGYVWNNRDELLFLFCSLQKKVLEDVYDYKGIQGNINNLDSSARKKLSERFYLVCLKMDNAIIWEKKYSSH